MHAAALATLFSAGLLVGVLLQITGATSHGNKALTVPSWFVAPNGSDSNPCTQAAPCATFNRGYQVAQSGQVVSIAAGSYPGQVIGFRSDLANATSCTAAATSSCVTLSVDGAATVNGSLEIHAPGIYVSGNSQLRVTGYIDTEADSTTNHPDHVVVQGTFSTSFGIFNADTVMFENMDVGPATVSTGCAILQGPGIENKIGWAGGQTFEPTNIVLDGLRIHDQNRDQGGADSGCHFGGLFLVTANGLTIKNTTFEHNAVYNTQIQNFVGPAATNVTFTNDAFGCPVNWLYVNNNPLTCNGQSSIQFDGTFPGVSIIGNAFAELEPGWVCAVAPCDFSGDTFSGNTYVAPSITAPPLPNQPPPPPPTTTAATTTAPTTTAPTTTAPTTTATTTTTPAEVEEACDPICDSLIAAYLDKISRADAVLRDSSLSWRQRAQRAQAILES